MKEPKFFSDNVYEYVGELEIENNSTKLRCCVFELQLDTGNAKIESFGIGGLHKWIETETCDGERVFLCDGAWSGWAGVLGGTQKILGLMKNSGST